MVSESGIGPIYNAMDEFFTQDDWHYERLGEKPMLEMRFAGDHGRWRCVARADEERERFFFYSILDTNVPEDKRPFVAEFITRANYGLNIGNFELDYTDGEVRYKTSVDVEGGELTQTMIKNMVYMNVLMMDKYLPGIMGVLYDYATPEQAVAKVEAE